MKSLPPCVAPYHRTPDFTEAGIPRTLQDDHATKTGVWGRIVVDSGMLLLTFAGTGEAITLRAGDTGIIAPEERHRVRAEGSVVFHVEFCR
ncbi:MAG: DUF1971 domain-containing protein [Proteobacteria bacterium]|nr:DUF1971 domain-containing protein [Pseudomonadota bacterium]